MIKRVIKYEDFNGTPRTDEVRFNLTKSELVMMQANEDLEKVITEAQKNKDIKTVMRIFRELILGAYGIKSDDGKRFVKSQELRDAFEQSAAYDALFMQLVSDEAEASAFVEGVLPKAE